MGQQLKTYLNECGITRGDYHEGRGTKPSKAKPRKIAQNNIDPRGVMPRKHDNEFKSKG